MVRPATPPPQSSRFPQFSAPRQIAAAPFAERPLGSGFLDLTNRSPPPGLPSRDTWFEPAPLPFRVREPVRLTRARGCFATPSQKCWPPNRISPASTPPPPDGPRLV